MATKRKYKRQNQVWKWVVIGITLTMSLVSLLHINTVASKMKLSEQEKITIWASALDQKSRLMSATETFFQSVDVDERRKMELYIQVLKSFNRIEPGSDAAFSLAYISYVVDSSKTSFIIMDGDSTITNCSNYTGDPYLDRALIGKKMTAEDIAKFTSNPPVHYKLWGMPMTLLYKESKMYSDIHTILNDLNESFLSEITQNSVFVPVIVVDGAKRNVIGYGNIDTLEFNTQEKLSAKLAEMEDDNQPIEFRLVDNQKAYVFYETTPLINQMKIIPRLYLIMTLILIVVSIILLRTAHNEEENHIWVGMAKETAHQLGTPISSLMAWVDYLDGKTMTEPYTTEIHKDLNRLEIIARRFSKIGSIPELQREDVCAVVNNTLSYLRPRTPKKIRFIKYISDEPLYADMNTILFEWVIENICKNAIDAMDGVGAFTVTVEREGKNINIDCSNTGKPIPSKEQKNIFESGFSTKTRGWGLGLSLAKRIICEYHNGEIFLKSSNSEMTTFRIQLRYKQ